MTCRRLITAFACTLLVASAAFAQAPPPENEVGLPQLALTAAPANGGAKLTVTSPAFKHMADIPFPRRVRDELVAEGRTGPHHVHPDSGWTTKYIRGDADADEVVALLRINYDRITELSDSLGETIELVEVENADQIEPLLRVCSCSSTMPR